MGQLLMPAVDRDGYPTVCHVCGRPIVKARHDSRHHYDHATATATSRHTTCTRKDKR